MTPQSEKIANICNIIFDLDGTLIDSSDGIVEAANYAFDQLNLQRPDPNEIKKYIGYPLDQMFSQFGGQNYEEFLNIFREYGNRSIVNAARPLDGVEITLGLLKQFEFNLGIATTKCQYHLDAIVARLGWVNYFDVLCGSDKIAHVKPDPEQIMLVMKMISGTPDNTIVVGDTINDINAAHAAGLKAIAIPSLFGDQKDLIESKPDITLDSIGQLVECLINNID